MTATPADIDRWNRLRALSADDVKALQLKKLREQIGRLEANPFHGPRLRAAGVSADGIRSVDDIRQIPTMGKADVLADLNAAPPFGHRLGIAPVEIRDIMTSGGTSGNAPEVYAYSADDLEFTTDLYAMDQYWKGARPGDIAMMVSHLGMLTSPPLNVKAWERIGLPVLRVGPNTTEERVATFARFRPNILKLPYAYSLRFIDALRSAGIDPKTGRGMKFLFVSGGAYPIEFAAAIEEFFGAKMHEVFGCSQAGAVTAGTCEHGVLNGHQRGVMHCYDHAFVTEVLDPNTGEHVQPGEEGELTLTQLWRQASPVLRYRMGDRVRYMGVGQCRCGMQVTALEAGTVARYDDMLRIKGVNLWTHELDAHILATPGVDEFNGAVLLDARGKERVALRVEIRADADATTVASTLAASLKREFHIAMEVEIVPHGTVRRFELKQRRWSDDRSARLALAGATLGQAAAA